MKTKLLRKARKNHKLLERNGKYKYKGGDFFIIETEWNKDLKSTRQTYINQILSWCYRKYDKAKNVL